MSTVAELASQHKVHINQITQWEKLADNALREVFGRPRAPKPKLKPPHRP